MHIAFIISKTNSGLGVGALSVNQSSCRVPRCLQADGFSAVRRSEPRGPRSLIAAGDRLCAGPRCCADLFFSCAGAVIPNSSACWNLVRGCCNVIPLARRGALKETLPCGQVTGWGGELVAGWHRLLPSPTCPGLLPHGQSPPSPGASPSRASSVSHTTCGHRP